MHLLRSLYFFQAAYQVRPLIEHIKRTHNELADAISHNNHQKFLSKLSYTQKVPDAVHLQLRQALVDQPVDWTLQAWRDLLANILPKD